MKRESIAMLAMFFLWIVSIFIIYNKFKWDTEERKQAIQLVESLNDSVKIWKDKEQLYHSKISVLETSKVKDFLNIKTKDSIIIELQKRVKQYENNLKDGSSVTIIKSETKYDTIYRTKEVIRDIIGDSIIIDSIVDNPWIYTKFGFSKDSTIFSLEVKNDYSLIIGEEKQGFLKARKPFAEVINENPYSISPVVRTYRVNDVRKHLVFKDVLIGGVGAISLIGILMLIFNIY